MTFLSHALAFLAVWFALSAAMGCFVGSAIERGGSDRG